LWTGSAATIVGVLAALAFGRAMAGFLVGISPQDPVSLLVASSVTCGAGIAGCLLAARGAARIDPADALRD
jgi:ABC-type antimicrobial peptide transport system permease subunit